MMMGRISMQLDIFKWKFHGTINKHWVFMPKGISNDFIWFVLDICEYLSFISKQNSFVFSIFKYVATSQRITHEVDFIFNVIETLASNEISWNVSSIELICIHLKFIWCIWIWNECQCYGKVPGNLFYLKNSLAEQWIVSQKGDCVQLSIISTKQPK